MTEIIQGHPSGLASRMRTGTFSAGRTLSRAGYGYTTLRSRDSKVWIQEQRFRDCEIQGARTIRLDESFSWPRASPLLHSTHGHDEKKSLAQRRRIKGSQ